MLTHIYIKDFALIREIDIDLMDNFNIITGETGTGKSIVIQAIDTALGGRGSSSLVAEWADKAVVQLIFDLNSEESAALAEFINEPEDNELIIIREFNKSGKSIARINGEIVNLSTLRKVTSLLINIHGQYDNQILMNSENYINVIDSYASKEIFPLKSELSNVYEEYSDSRKELQRLKKNHSEFLRRLDFIKFEADEITNAAPIENEDIELSERLNILQNSEKISAALSETYEILHNQKLSRAADLLTSISEYSEKYSDFAESISNCSYILDDISSEIRNYRDETNYTPSEIDATIERLDLLDKLKRKYGGSIEKVLEYRDNCLVQLDKFVNIEGLESELSEKLSEKKKKLAALCSKLSELRHAAAAHLSEKMMSELQDLNFTNASFHISVADKFRDDGEKELSSNGSDEVSFLFNANKGGTLKPLAEIASGGEISRISLAFQHIINDSDHVRVMIFDEIDTGISGITASVVGNKMQQISDGKQIICITHLPQIAAAGDYQYLISKDDSDDHSYTTIKLLNDSERITELARLLGGRNVTETTLASARELIDAAHR